MSRNGQSSSLKPIISVREMARALGHSRARFYQLQGTIYPPPIYDIRTRRPFYDAHLQQVCQHIRQTGMGWNGQYILFYSPRSNSPQTSAPRSPRKRSRVNQESKELAETLNSMGLSVSASQVEQGVQELYPEGLAGEHQGIVIRELFRHLKQG